MSLLHYDLENLQQGILIEVTLQGNATTVLLLDEENFQHYKTGDTYYFVGGFVQRSPVYLRAPQEGRWHLVLDDMNGTVQSSLRLVKDSPAAARNLMSRVMYNDGTSTREAPGGELPLKGRYDVFIAYVPEDKSELARPLAHAFAKCGVRAGFDEFEIKEGNPSMILEKGLLNCRYGVFIISRNTLSDKRWKAGDWEAATSKVVGRPVFAVWHGVEAADIAPYSEELSMKPARWTGINTLDNIAAEIAAVIRA